MSLSAKHRDRVAELVAVTDPQDRMALLVQRGRQLGGLPDGDRTEARLVPGCLSKLWFVPSFADGRCSFRCDSESAIVKGIASLLCDFFSQCTSGEILAYQGDFLSEAGIDQHLTPNRRNGLGRLRHLIREFAAAHAASNPPG